MMSLSYSPRNAISTINDSSRRVFEWSVRPLILALWPRRHKWWVQNLANIISTIRLPISVVVVVIMVYPAYTQRDIKSLYAGLFVMLLVLLSDGIDGALARGLMTTSRYGKAIDPLADKFFYLSMVVCLVVGAWQMVPRETVVAFTIFLLPAIYFEVRLVIIALVVDKECRHRQSAEPAGSNIWGKAKFALQSGVGFLGFGVPWVTAGFSLATGMLVLALPMAYLSLKGHQLDLEAIRLKPIALGAKLAPTTPPEF